MDTTTIIKMLDSQNYTTFTSNRRNDSAHRCEKMLRHQEEIDQLMNMAAALLKSHPSVIAKDTADRIEELCIKLGGEA